LEDSIGQITRVVGQNIELSSPTPSIESIMPSGFAGKAIISLDPGPLSFSIIGEEFGNGSGIKFTDSNGTGKTIPRDTNGIVFSNTQITVNIPTTPLPELPELPKLPDIFSFLTSNESYTITVVAGSESSNGESIFISADENTTQPEKGITFVTFQNDNIKSLDSGKNPLAGIPLLRDGQSAQISLKSRTKLFKKQNSGKIFAYLAFEQGEDTDEAISKFSLPSNIALFDGVMIDGVSVNLKIPTNVEYSFTSSITGDFFKFPFTNKKAGIKFPGKYSSHNFSGLVDLDKAYFIIANRQLPPGLISLETEDYQIIQVGQSEGEDILPPFVEPSVVLGIAASTGIEDAGTVSSTFIQSDIPNFPTVDIFGGGVTLAGRGIDSYEKISTMAIVVSGSKETFKRKRYDIKIGGKSIKSDLVGDPIELEGGDKIVFIYSNVTPNRDGVLSVTVEKNDRIFNVKTTSDNIYRQGTALVKGLDTNYTIDEKTGTLDLKTNVVSLISGNNTKPEGVFQVQEFLDDPFSIAALIGAESVSVDGQNKAELLFKSNNSGILFDKTANLHFTGTHFVPFSTLSILPSIAMTLGVTDGPFEETKLGTASSTEANILSRRVLQLNSGGFLFSGNYIDSRTDDAAMLFFNTRITGGATIRHNVPIITHIGQGDKNITSGDSFNEESVIQLVVGRKITIRYKNSRRNVTFRSTSEFGEVNLKPIGMPKQVGLGTYDATVKIPITLAGAVLSDGKCFDICASPDNADRNGAKLALGRAFVVDLDKTFEDLLGGKLKEGMADFQDLTQKLADAPLQFVNGLLDKALVHKDLINAFCDLSFHLLAELKINLNGLKVLMIPLQVILCIIDVICALLNPVKLAKAVIRLFQCLYDLILLLPPISIPAMFIRLILHLLELIECVIEKVLFTIIAINEISKAMSNAIEDKNWAAIKALEEVLSEYLFEIEMDLSFLEPVLSILAIFLQLLQLAFRFPCKPSTGEEDPPACIDGSMLAGIVGGTVAPELEILPNALIPVGQPYSFAADGSTASLTDPVNGNEVGTTSEGTTYLDSMNVDPDSVRANADFPFNVTFAPTFTKSRKGFGDPTIVKFQFKERSRTRNREKFIDPTQTVDSPLALMKIKSNSMRIDLDTNGGHFISPIDGSNFINKNVTDGSGTATVKPLVLEFETPILEVDETTGLVTQVGTDIVTRTFDDIPKMAIMDEEFNVYFIEPDGIEFEEIDNTSYVSSIKAKMINFPSAPKLKFSKEDVEQDTNDDGVVDGDDDPDDTQQIFDLPQLYFVDMRQAAAQISEACAASSINTFLFDFNDTNSDQIEDIVDEANTCLEDYLAGVRALTAAVRTSQEAGEVPEAIDTVKFEELNQILRDCLGGTVDDMCKFVVNSLNTSFQILEDSDSTPLEGFTDGSISDLNQEDLPDVGQPFTGAREYAEGIGDSATIGVGETANILLVPRDSYDIPMGGDLTDKIILEIISDETGTAEFIENAAGTIVTKNGSEYTAELVAKDTGEVRIKATICSRVIQAVTFEGIDIIPPSDSEVDCIPDTVEEIIGESPALGALTKVDRILTVFYIKRSSVALSQSEDSAEIGKTQPQEFGSGLEN
jgi:hypothetical protein